MYKVVYILYENSAHKFKYKSVSNIEIRVPNDKKKKRKIHWIATRQYALRFIIFSFTFMISMKYDNLSIISLCKLYTYKQMQSLKNELK